MKDNEPLLVESNEKRGFISSHYKIIIPAAIAVAVVIIVGCVFLFGRGTTHIDRLSTGSYKIADTDCYVTGTADAMILIMPDIYGMSVEVKQIADYYATKGGFTTIVVDYFNGDPRTNASDPDWNNRHPQNLSLALASGVIAAVRERGYSNLQVQGYCYGGKSGVSLTFINITNLPIRSSVVAHPSGLTQSDAGLIQTPIFFVQPQTDGFNSLAAYFNETLTDNGITSQFKIYPNTSHGFAVSATANPVQKQIAMDDSLNWFIKYGQPGAENNSASYLLSSIFWLVVSITIIYVVM